MQLETIVAAYDLAGKIPGAGEGALLLKKFLENQYGEYSGKYIALPEMKVHNSVEDVACFCGELRDAVYATLSNGKFALILGGDHSIAIGSIAGAMAVDGANVGVVYIDAHADMNTFETSSSKNIHGMPLAVCMGEGNATLKGVVPVQLDSSHLFLLGTRSIDPGEAELLESQKIKYLSSDYINNHSLNDVVLLLRDFISRNDIKKLHLSFDIDVIDPAYAPATGVPEVNGVSPLKVEKLLECVFATGLVGSMDIVEYNPQLDIAGRTNKLCERFADLTYGLIKAL